MRISMLLQREPFGEIFEKTIPAFFESRQGKKVQVKWLLKCCHASRKRGAQVWLCNHYINAIFAEGAKKKVFAQLLGEYSRSTNPWLRPLQHVYAHAATRRPFRGVLAGSSIEITPPLNGSEDMVFMGGNNRIRLLDYQSQRSYVICKHGFDRQLVQEEVQLRKGKGYLPSPKLCEADEAGAWFGEEIVSGVPINRLPDRAGEAEALERVLGPLFRLYKETLEHVKPSDYAADLAGIIERDISGFKLLASRDVDRLGAYVRDLRGVAGDSRGDVVLAQSHGDFQPANILRGDSGVWLVDWEYSARRQIAYDGFVFSLSSRFPSGLAARLKRAVKGEETTLAHLMGRWPGVEWEDVSTRRCSLALFLLEEVALRVREGSNPMFTQLDQGFSRLYVEMGECIKALRRAV